MSLAVFALPPRIFTFTDYSLGKFTTLTKYDPETSLNTSAYLAKKVKQ